MKTKLSVASWQERAQPGRPLKTERVGPPMAVLCQEAAIPFVRLNPVASESPAGFVESEFAAANGFIKRKLELILSLSTPFRIARLGPEIPGVRWVAANTQRDQVILFV